MPTYLILARYTQKGAEAMKNSPTRLEQAKQLARSKGGEIKAFYLTMGQYDFAVIAEAPSDAVMAESLLKLGEGGWFRTETLRAFTEDEYRQIVGKLG